MDQDAAVQKLRDYVDRAGTQRRAAKTLGISYQYLNDVLHSRRDPECVLKRIGLRRVVTYEKQP